MNTWTAAAEAYLTGGVRLTASVSQRPNETWAWMLFPHRTSSVLSVMSSAKPTKAEACEASATALRRFFRAMF